MNWVDLIILITLVFGLVNGFREGFVRIVIGFGALIIAFLTASWFHGYATGYLAPLIGAGVLASVLGYALVFVVVVLLGSLIAAVLVRALGLVGLTVVDRVMGAGLGVVRATVTLVIASMVLMAFAPNRMPAGVRDSRFAPYVLRASDVISAATPNGIRTRVEETYDDLKEKLDDLRSKRRN